MKTNVRLYVYSVIAAALLISAGCGGGGGGGSAPTAVSAPSGGSGTVGARVKLPKISDVPIDAFTSNISVVEFGESGEGNTLTQSVDRIEYNEEEDKYTGDSSLSSIPEGTNYVVKIAATAEFTDTAAARVANAKTTYTTVFLAGIVPSIVSGEFTEVQISPESTVTALAAILYARTRAPAVRLSNIAVISPAVILAIDEAVASLVQEEALSTDRFVFADADPFVVANWDADTVRTLEDVLVRANLIEADRTPPQVIDSAPSDGAADVPYYQPVFHLYFSESLDSSIDLNDQAALDASGFAITLAERGGAMDTVAIDSTNALSLGSFAWENQSGSADVLAYRLNARGELSDATPISLNPGATYDITLWNAPANVKDLSGNAIDAAGVSRPAAAFTVMAYVYAPNIVDHAPANNAVDVPYDMPVFKLVYSKSMDTSIDLNDPAALQASGFSLILSGQKDVAGIVVDTTNAASYGVFSWSTTNAVEDTLEFAFNDSAALEAANLKPLAPGDTYSFAFASPVNVVGAQGRAPSDAGTIVSDSFSTEPDNLAVLLGTPDNEEVRLIRETPDGGYIVLGYSYAQRQAGRARSTARTEAPPQGRQSARTANAGGGSQYFLMKVNARLEQEWITFHDSTYNYLEDIRPTADGGFIAAGSVYDPVSYYSSAYVARLDSAGNVVWEQSYLEGTYSYFSSVLESSDGGIVVAGYNYPETQSNYFPWVLKIDSSGNTEWSLHADAATTNSTITYGYTYDLHHHANGGYFITGYAQQSSVYGQFTWIVNADGTHNSINFYEYTNRWFYKGIETGDGGYVFAGSNYTNGHDNFWLVKFDSTGAQSWEATFEDVDHYAYANSVDETNDGGFILTGYSYDLNYSQAQVRVVKANSAGTIEWVNDYGGPCYEYGRGVFALPEGGYIVGATSYSYSDINGGEVLLFKVDENGNAPGLADLTEVTVCSVVDT